MARVGEPLIDPRTKGYLCITVQVCMHTVLEDRQLLVPVLPSVRVLVSHGNPPAHFSPHLTKLNLWYSSTRVIPSQSLQSTRQSTVSKPSCRRFTPILSTKWLILRKIASSYNTSAYPPPPPPPSSSLSLTSTALESQHSIARHLDNKLQRMKPHRNFPSPPKAL